MITDTNQLRAYWKRLHKSNHNAISFPILVITQGLASISASEIIKHSFKTKQKNRTALSASLLCHRKRFIIDITVTKKE